MADETSEQSIWARLGMIIFALVITVGALVTVVMVNKMRPRGSKEVARMVSSPIGGECVKCHLNVTPGIVAQYSKSTMAAAGFTCENCHQVNKDAPLAQEHNGFHIVRTPTAKQCAACHPKEYEEFVKSRHGAMAWAAVAGTSDFSPDQLKLYAEAVKHNQTAAVHPPNLKIPADRAYGCQTCHSIGKPNADGSIGSCNSCHLRHEYSVEQSRRPETCYECHATPGSDVDQVFTMSPHGRLYATQGDRWNWRRPTGRLTVADFGAPTCALCHMSGLGQEPTTHDLGARSAYLLSAFQSDRRPKWDERRSRMLNLCASCHPQSSTLAHFDEADTATAEINRVVREAVAASEALKKKGLLSDGLLSKPLDFVLFNLWHSHARDAKHGAYMSGPNFVNWEGTFKMREDLAKLKAAGGGK